MENQIEYNKQNLKWEYEICPCENCPIYMKNKSCELKECETVRCKYNKQLARNIANDIFFMMHMHYCNECKLWFDKEDYIDRPFCPSCGSDFR